jgi:ankyrin repeat protein
MDGTWGAAKHGDRSEVERLLGHDPGLLDVKNPDSRTPLVVACKEGHVEVVRCLIDKGAATNTQGALGGTALYCACDCDRLPVVRLLVERGADPTVATVGGSTPLIAASRQGHLEVVRFLLNLPSVKATINHRRLSGQTALWDACLTGRGAVARALLARGADPTTANTNGTTPVATAKAHHHLPSPYVSAEGRRECVAALEVSTCPTPLTLARVVLI